MRTEQTDKSSGNVPLPSPHTPDNQDDSILTDPRDQEVIDVDCEIENYQKHPILNFSYHSEEDFEIGDEDPLFIPDANADAAPYPTRRPRKSAHGRIGFKIIPGTKGKCLLSNCEDLDLRSVEFRTFHRFPGNPIHAKRKEKWIQFVRLATRNPLWIPKDSNSQLCSRHFFQSDYVSPYAVGVNVRLKSNAIPQAPTPHGRIRKQKFERLLCDNDISYINNPLTKTYPSTSHGENTTTDSPPCIARKSPEPDPSQENQPVSISMLDLVKEEVEEDFKIEINDTESIANEKIHQDDFDSLLGNEIGSDDSTLIPPTTASIILGAAATAKPINIFTSKEKFPNPYVSLERLSRQQIEKFKTTLLPTSTKAKKKYNLKKKQCPHCPVKTSAIKQHVRRVHSGERPFACPHCSHASKHSGTLKLHLDRMHPKDPLAPPAFKCLQCPKAFSFPRDLQQHILRSHGEKTILCHHCPYTTRSESLLTLHIKSKHESPVKVNSFSCYFCSRKYNLRQQFLSHMWKHTGERPFKCPKCEFSTTNYSFRSLHVKRYHPELIYDRGGVVERPGEAAAQKQYISYPCPQCAASYYKLGPLTRHVNEVHGAKTPGMVKCYACDFEALNRNAMREHVRKEHPKGESNFHCHLCPKEFKQKKHLRDHLNAHAGLKPFKCPFCPFASHSSSNLYQHKKTCKEKPDHTENDAKRKKFQCLLCPKRFYLKKNLRDHLNAHAGVKPFKCPFCPKVFRSSTNLYQHKKLCKGRRTENKDQRRTEDGGLNVIEITSQAVMNESHISPMTVKSDPSQENPSVPILHFVREEQDKIEIDDTESTTIGEIHPQDSPENQIDIDADDAPILVPSSSNSGAAASESPKMFSSEDKLPNPDVSLKRPNQQQPEKLSITSPIKRKKKKRYHPNKKQCPHCPVKALSMKTHLRVHTGERPFACPHCPYTAKVSGNLKQHLDIMHPKDPLAPPAFKCAQCPKAFKTYAYLQLHVWRTHGEKNILCHHCPFRTHTESALILHINSTHESSTDAIFSFSCYFCSRKFKQRTYFFTHMWKHTGEKPLKCPKSPECDFSTTEYAYRSNHVRRYHPELISKSRKRPEGVAARKQYKRGRYPCSHCAATYNGLQSLTRHVNEVHGAKTPGMLKCFVCDFEALNRDAMRKHMRKKHPKGEANFHCHLCPKKFKQTHHLRDHLNFHAGVKPFRCPFCPVAFCSPSNLYQHKKICKGREDHTEKEDTEEPFKNQSSPTTTDWKRKRE